MLWNPEETPWEEGGSKERKDEAVCDDKLDLKCLFRLIDVDKT